jgi:catechol 2,3-dioxygenase-like lactoylglutathione lyase family enzyme
MKNRPLITPEFKVFNFKESLAFYVELLGFTIEYARPEDDFAMLEKEGTYIMIEELTSSRFWETGEMEAPLGRGMNLQIEIQDVDEVYNKLKEVNYPIFFEMEEKWYRKNNKEVGNRQFLIQDPSGYLLRFAKDLGIREIKNKE